MGWVSLPSDIYVDELSHYGAKGQKWGRRRWQNPDGSYTQAGRVHYGIGLFKKKSKMSKDAKLRAKERVRAKNEAARQEAYEAEARRALAETEAERAKTALREAKKQNSLAYKLGAKAASVASDKMSERKAEKESRKPLSKNAEKYIDAIQSGNKRKIKKYAAKLNNDEYRKAIDRINMKYEMDRLATDNKIAKGKQTVDRLRNTANAISSGVDIWNAGAGIVSAFSGVNVPKVNTKYEDPIDKLKKQLEYQTKQEALNTAKAGADKARYLAKQEKVKADTALKDYYEKYPEEKPKPAAPSKKDDPYGWYKPETTYRNQSMGADKGWSSLGTMKTKDSYTMDTFSKVIPKTEPSAAIKNLAKQASKKNMSRSFINDSQKALNDAASLASATKILAKYGNNKAANAYGRAGSVASAISDIYSIGNTNSLNRKAHKVGKQALTEALLKKASGVDRQVINAGAIRANEILKLNNEIEKAKSVSTGQVDVTKLSDEAKKLFFGILEHSDT